MRVYQPRRYEFVCKCCRKVYTAKNIRSEYCGMSCRVNQHKKQKRVDEFLRLVELTKARFLERMKNEKNGK